MSDRHRRFPIICQEGGATPPFPIITQGGGSSRTSRMRQVLFVTKNGKQVSFLATSGGSRKQRIRRNIRHRQRAQASHTKRLRHCWELPEGRTG